MVADSEHLVVLMSMLMLLIMVLAMRIARLVLSMVTICCMTILGVHYRMTILGWCCMMTMTIRCMMTMISVGSCFMMIMAILGRRYGTVELGS